MNRYGTVTAITLILQLSGCSQGPHRDSIIWNLDNLESISGNRVTVLGSPTIVDSPMGPSIEFDGKGDAIVLDTNPLTGFDQFTVEIVFRPDPDGSEEQRFLHLQEVDTHRVLIETRLTDDGRWFLDTFMKSGEAERTLYAENSLHPVGRWFHAALTYDGRTMRHYVNGEVELEAEVAFAPMEGGQTSIGCRLNRVYWFKGAIHRVAFTPRVLRPQEFRLQGAGDKMRNANPVGRGTHRAAYVGECRKSVNRLPQFSIDNLFSIRNDWAAAEYGRLGNGRWRDDGGDLT